MKRVVDGNACRSFCTCVLAVSERRLQAAVAQAASQKSRILDLKLREQISWIPFSNGSMRRLILSVYVLYVLIWHLMG
jgi:hypothetical protein